MSTLREMTKSPLAVAREALAVATATLPAYASKFSRRTFTRPQLVAILAVRVFLKTDYRGVVAYLRDWSDLRSALGLARVPHFTTLQKVAAGLKKVPRGPPDRGPRSPSPRPRSGRRSTRPGSTPVR